MLSGPESARHAFGPSTASRFLPVVWARRHGTRNGALFFVMRVAQACAPLGALFPNRDARQKQSVLQNDRSGAFNALIGVWNARVARDVPRQAAGRSKRMALFDQPWFAAEVKDEPHAAQGDLAWTGRAAPTASHLFPDTIVLSVSQKDDRPREARAGIGS